MEKTCLKCHWSDFFKEKNDELYTYESDCNLGAFPERELLELYSCKTDDEQELEATAHPIFEKVAKKCEHYEPDH